MPEKRILRKMYGKKKERTGKRRKLRTVELHNSASSNIVRMFKTMRVWWGNNCKMQGRGTGSRTTEERLRY
jgi:hypothetical protein